MTESIVMPDPLDWRAGHEFGLEGISLLKDESLSFVIASRGEFLEAVAFAIHEFGLTEQARYVRNPSRRLRKGTVALFPRVTSFEPESIHRSLARGARVVCSDPDYDSHHPLFLKTRPRDAVALAIALRKALELDPGDGSRSYDDH